MEQWERMQLEHIFAEFREMIQAIAYKPGWSFRTGEENGRMFVQVCVSDEAEASYDMIAKKRVPWRGAKHWLSPHMCRQEVVGTVFGAIRAAEEHEMKEWFRYRGAAIFNPHLSPDALADFARRKTSFEFRNNAMTMKEDQ